MLLGKAPLDSSISPALTSPNPSIYTDTQRLKAGIYQQIPNISTD